MVYVLGRDSVRHREERDAIVFWRNTIGFCAQINISVTNMSLCYRNVYQRQSFWMVCKKCEMDLYFSLSAVLAKQLPERQFLDELALIELVKKNVA